MTSQMTERVARVLANNPRKNYGKPFEDMHQSLQDAYREDARDAIAAMREPTDAMSCAINDAIGELRFGGPDPWRAGIDAALGEQS